MVYDIGWKLAKVVGGIVGKLPRAFAVEVELGSRGVVGGLGKSAADILISSITLSPL